MWWTIGLAVGASLYLVLAGIAFHWAYYTNGKVATEDRLPPVVLFYACIFWPIPLTLVGLLFCAVNFFEQLCYKLFWQKWLLPGGGWAWDRIGEPATLWSWDNLINPTRNRIMESYFTLHSHWWLRRQAKRRKQSQVVLATTKLIPQLNLVGTEFIPRPVLGGTTERKEMDHGE
jgi:hypothetical protein